MGTETVQSRDLHRIQSGQEWSGYLTLENLDAVAERIKSLIGDGRRYTGVYSSEYFWAHRPPQIRTNCAVQEINVCREPFAGRPAGSIAISDGHYLCDLITDVADQNEAWRLPEKDRPPYLHFKHDRVEVTDHAPAGNKCFQVYAVEERAL